MSRSRTLSTPLKHPPYSLVNIIISIMYCSVVLNAFVLLYSHHHHPFPEHLHLPKLKLCTNYTITPHSSFLLDSATTILLSVSMNLTILVTSKPFLNYQDETPFLKSLCFLLFPGVFPYNAFQLVLSYSTHTFTG